MNLERFLKKAGGAELITVAPDATIAETARLLTAKRKGLALVNDPEGKLLGVVSVIDITRAVGREEERAAAMPVDAVMTRDFCTCQLSESVEAALARMSERGIRHLPVLHGERLVGLVNLRGLLEQRFKEVGTEAEDMRKFVYGVGYH